MKVDTVPFQPENNCRKRRRVDELQDEYSHSLASPYPSVVYTVTSSQHSPDTSVFTFSDENEKTGMLLNNTIIVPPLPSISDLEISNTFETAAERSIVFTKGPSRRYNNDLQVGLKKISCVTPTSLDSNSKNVLGAASSSHNNSDLLESRFPSSSQHNPYSCIPQSSSHELSYATTYESADNHVHLIEDDDSLTFYESDNDNREGCSSTSIVNYLDAYSLDEYHGEQSSEDYRGLDGGDDDLSFDDRSLKDSCYTYSSLLSQDQMKMRDHFNDKKDEDYCGTASNQDHEIREIQIHASPPLPQCHSNDSEFLTEQQLRKHFLDVTQYNATIAEANATLMRQAVDAIYEIDDDAVGDEECDGLYGDLALSNLITPPTIMEDFFSAYAKGDCEIDADALEQQQIIKNVVEPVSREMKQIIAELEPVHNFYPNEFNFDAAEHRWYAQVSRSIDDVYYHQPSSGRIVHSVPFEFMDTCDARRRTERMVRENMDIEPTTSRECAGSSQRRQPKWEPVPDDEFVKLVRPERHKPLRQDGVNRSTKKRHLRSYLLVLFLTMGLALVKYVTASGLLSTILPHSRPLALSTLLVRRLPMVVQEFQSKPPWLNLECLGDVYDDRCQWSCAPT